MVALPTIATCTDTLLPNTTLFQSPHPSCLRLVSSCPHPVAPLPAPATLHPGKGLEAPASSIHDQRLAIGERRLLGGQEGHGRRDIFGRSGARSEENTSELHSLMRISYAVSCLKK